MLCGETIPEEDMKHIESELKLVVVADGVLTSTGCASLCGTI